ncbi:MAG: hypothetical protein LDLANPLL_01554 [Turneriella sp.]|nr:hypothetical protein [Turneriella sp.]
MKPHTFIYLVVVLSLTATLGAAKAAPKKAAPQNVVEAVPAPISTTYKVAPTLYAFALGSLPFAKPSDFLQQALGASLDFRFSFWKPYLQPYVSLSYAYSGGKEHVKGMNYATALAGLSYEFTPLTRHTAWRVVPHLVGGYTRGAIDYTDTNAAPVTRTYGVPQIALGVLNDYRITQRFSVALALRAGYLFEHQTPLPYAALLLGAGYTF